MVDAGLFQGLKELRERNWQDLPVPASSIQAIVLTHAHLDHCGYLPRLVAQGFRGRVFCTAGTQDLCRIVLPDSAKLQEEDASYANRHGFSRHTPALPLYRDIDASRALSQLQPCGYDRRLPIANGIEVEFVNAGHLLGSSCVRMWIDGRMVLFGGDLGRYGRPVLPDPTPAAEADYLLVESTYGDRVHEQDDNGARLAEIVTSTAHRGGKLIIPAFAIGRVEELCYWLKRLEGEKRIPILPVFVDSPMASAALAKYSERVQELDPELQPEQRDDKAPHDAAAPHPSERPPAAGDAGARALHLLYAAFSRDRVRRGVEAADGVEDAVDRDLVERHGRGRARAAPSQSGASRPAQHRAVRRLPGRGHARPPAGRR